MLHCATIYALLPDQRIDTVESLNVQSVHKCAVEQMYDDLCHGRREGGGTAGSLGTGRILLALTPMMNSRSAPWRRAGLSGVCWRTTSSLDTRS